MSAHRLIVIGWMGVRRAYLDVPLEEARRRYADAERFGEDDVRTVDALLAGVRVSEFDFDDEFGVYDAWAL